MCYRWQRRNYRCAGGRAIALPELATPVREHDKEQCSIDIGEPVGPAFRRIEDGLHQSGACGCAVAPPELRPALLVCVEEEQRSVEARESAGAEVAKCIV